MYLLSIFLPFVSFLILSLQGHKLGRKGSSFFAITLLFLTCFISFFIFYEVVLCHSVTTLTLFT